MRTIAAFRRQTTRARWRHKRITCCSSTMTFRSNRPPCNSCAIRRERGSQDPGLSYRSFMKPTSKDGVCASRGRSCPTWAADGFAKHLVLLDRNRSAPQIPGVRTRAMEPYDYARIEHDKRLLQHICDEESASVFISTYYTTPITSPSVFMAYDMIPEIFGW